MAQIINGIATIPAGEKKRSCFGSRSGVYHISGKQLVDPVREKRLGSLTMLPTLPTVNIHFSDLSYTVPDRRRGSKRLLSGLSGTFYSQKLTAIMGPSGAGKSTLLNVLAGYKTRGQSGSVTLNGIDRKSLSSYRRLLSYIMQEDHLMAHLTVHEAMTIAAHLKLGDQFSTKGKAIVVDEILETLGLTDCKETRTANLSGGQQKRLSIALELINNPPILFFDEPTSGLDSSSCFQCLSLLKTLARGGRTIICSIHQPSARLFEMLDNLYVLAEGQCIYQGRVQGLVPFLGSLGLECPSYHNPADYVIEIASGEHGDVIPRVVNAVKNGQCAAYLDCDSKMADDPVNGVVMSSESSLEESFSSSAFPISHFRQFWILWKRTLVCTVRDMSLFWVRLSSHIICGLLIGIIYYQIGNEASKVVSNSSCLFFTVLFLMFTAMMPTITTFPMEKKVFIKEHMNHWYSLISFYFAKTIADIPFQILFSSIYVTIVYFLSSQPNEWFRYLMVLAIGFLVSLVAQSLGLFIGASLTVEKGVYIGPVLNVPILLFSGFFVSINSIPGTLRWLSEISYIRYGFEGTIQAVYGYNRTNLHCSEPYCNFKSPVKFLREMDMEDANFTTDCAALLVFFLLLRILCYVVLKWNLYLRN
ncbi:ATP-binding cassette sub-family G member 1-like [Macrosteles quadrilineatus]|uniref:ATP-binding cassette sub-family G member 1-like n=1 Tax=Macrosteles quadrilineatus TaxID=74068 RepID=UPI0023E26DCC|nr:ATP-binding cassette sub-family G member 1-like [Macrosteles quadrilineatus]XP_054261384.1 ATP-binding cassette sub-family G member 1-like [Macrosteles quadrilineatus]